MQTKIYFDFEFIDDGREIIPISLGMCTNAIAMTKTAPEVVAGHKAVGDHVQCDFYIEYQFDPARANDWVRENIFPHLELGENRGTCGEKRSNAARLIKEWVADVCGDTKPQFIGYYPAYDWVCLCQHFGTLMQRPTNWPMKPVCLAQMAKELSIDYATFPAKPENEHHALFDAKWNRTLHEKLLR